ncbi:hypothetical protein [Kutzneria buriramensis]|uniref:Uncharacterized protein n=1 Tax=Kutzneria buriramensis TaxID=1045776 RepID=A0A3E0HG35_9PSEU|nr:hypothetical protein [Kutzneria buriramensis]REH43775.1 hypothetical protein BCF44_109318 [Kutzneria buriramensis]
MAAEQSQSWRLTDDERRKAVSSAASFVASLIGPGAEFLVWGFEYFYNRRDLIFNGSGAPAQAFTAQATPVRLSALASNTSGGRLSINTPLTAAAQRAGLRTGDPVSVVLSGHQFTQSRSGLVVPTRIGDRVQVSVPNGTYSAAAFGSGRQALFTAKDPFQTVAGGNVLLTGRGGLDLSLTTRTPVPAKLTWTCSHCGQTATGNAFAHSLICPARPTSCNCDLCRRRRALPHRQPNPPPPGLWQRFLDFLDDL